MKTSNVEPRRSTERSDGATANGDLQCHITSSFLIVPLQQFSPTPSPRDHDRFDNHTFSTTTNNFMSCASILGHANGTTKGGLPCTCVTSYKRSTIEMTESTSSPSPSATSKGTLIYIFPFSLAAQPLFLPSTVASSLAEARPPPVALDQDRFFFLIDYQACMFSLTLKSAIGRILSHLVVTLLVIELG
ncbi:hypothetical protein GW17_00060006 [Ensete ventricosum]|nr:hypothetical protein GW17_00060006 [Ensete ventricosum]